MDHLIHSFTHSEEKQNKQGYRWKILKQNKKRWLKQRVHGSSMAVTQQPMHATLHRPNGLLISSTQAIRSVFTSETQNLICLTRSLSEEHNFHGNQTKVKSHQISLSLLRL